MILSDSQKDHSGHGVENGLVGVEELPNTEGCDHP